MDSEPDKPFSLKVVWSGFWGVLFFPPATGTVTKILSQGPPGWVTWIPVDKWVEQACINGKTTEKDKLMEVEFPLHGLLEL